MCWNPPGIATGWPTIWRSVVSEAEMESIVMVLEPELTAKMS